MTIADAATILRECPMPDCDSNLVGTGKLPCGVITVSCGQCGLSVPGDGDKASAITPPARSMPQSVRSNKMNDEIKDWNFEKLVTMATWEVLQHVLNGSLKDGVNLAILLALRWKDEQDKKIIQ